FHTERLAGAGITCTFVQENRVRSERAGTVRGLHFQLPPHAQAKLISVLRGRIFDVVVDIRRGSPTYGRVASVELGAETGRQLYVPVGFAHGYCTLEAGTETSYKTSAYYAPRYEGEYVGMTPTLRLRGRSTRPPSSFRAGTNAFRR